MNRFPELLFCALSAAVFLALLPLRTHAGFGGRIFEPPPPPAEFAAEGRALFLRDWTRPLNAEGDGLGPQFNARSCVACHSQGGIGGGGDNDHNVHLLTALPTHRTGLKLAQVHPALTRRNLTVVLHHFSVEDNYGNWRLGRLGAQLNDDLTAEQRSRALRAWQRRQRKWQHVVDLPDFKGVRVKLSQRSTPALFGAGLIDQIPAVEILRIVERQARQEDGVRGRFALRFGWRGQTATLREFVHGACANELGLQVPGHTQAVNPLRPADRLAGFDLTLEQSERLVTFVTHLPRPQQIMPRRPENRQLIKYGEQLFSTVGCGTCHVKRVGEVNGLFSDLLLHDMGSRLADPAPAAAAHGTISEQHPPGGYFSPGLVEEFAKIPAETMREWRTPPLWGVADSAPYLHDGRAATLREAIAYHGGEADSARRQFKALSRNDQTFLIAFLKTLAAPRR